MAIGSSRWYRVTELADKVGLSISPCHRRVRELERSGAIRGYRAVVDPEAVGLGFEAIVFITMRQEDRETLMAFEEGVAAIPQVLQAERLFGEPDYPAAHRDQRPGRIPAAAGRQACRTAGGPADDVNPGHEAHRARPAAASLALPRANR